jgi:hypothetical protein
MPSGFSSNPTFRSATSTWEIWPDDLLKPAAYSFILYVSETTGNAFKRFGPYQLIVSCGPGSTVITSNVKVFSYTYFVGESNVGRTNEYELFIPKFTNSNPNCPIVEESISASKTSLQVYDPIPDIVLGLDGLTLTINTRLPFVYEFYAFTKAQGEAIGTSQKITFTVMEIIVDDTLSNMAPFFASDVADEEFNIANPPFIVSLPDILDAHDNFQTIEFDSVLGTSKYPKDGQLDTGFLSYDPDKN